MKLSSKWWQHGFWNTLEHGLTRAADALTTFVLLWLLPIETFSKLALAQALVAPVLLFFVAPETVMYRDYAKWKEDGLTVFASRLRAFRLFALGKAQFAILISFAAASLFSGTDGWLASFFAIVWAFSLVLAPQLSGGDREFLRLELKLRELNGISLFQKLFLLIGTWIVVILFPNRIDLLALVAACAAVFTALIAKALVQKTLIQLGVSHVDLSGQGGVSVISTLRYSLHTFSIWTHLTGVVLNWIQTMDLFFLGVFRYPVREVGLYVVALKISNFSMAIPVAVSNLFSIWVGRRSFKEGQDRERYEIKRLSLWFLIGSFGQMILILLLAPLIISLLSHGRWTFDEQSSLIKWMIWILGGGVIFNSTLLLSSWLALRHKISELFKKVYCVWFFAAAIIYATCAWYGGPFAVAVANVFVVLVYAVLLWFYYSFSCPSNASHK